MAQLIGKLARRDWFALSVVTVPTVIAIGAASMFAGHHLGILLLAQFGGIVAVFSILAVMFLFLPAAVLAGVLEVAVGGFWRGRATKRFRREAEALTFEIKERTPAAPVLVRSIGRSRQHRLDGWWPPPEPRVPLRNLPFAEVSALAWTETGDRERLLLVQVETAANVHVFRRNATFPPFTRAALVLVYQRELVELPDVSAHANAQRLGPDVPAGWQRLQVQRESIDLSNTHVLSHHADSDELAATVLLDPRVLVWCLDHPQLSWEAAGTNLVVHRDVSTEWPPLEGFLLAARRLVDCFPRSVS